ncbi:rhodanese-like domain-containing protein [Pseudoalteromonas sp. T1lg65]|uniref:rhodanese-like domain-containing protein n=1 Tax=Pseudoalteromonas sp. T1lg65 TaxID=2077101 RepID=UPI003F7AB469
MIQAFRSLGVIILLFCMQVHAKQSISQQELLINQMSDSPYVIVDVRTPQEFSEGHIKGAINIPYNRIVKNRELVDRHKDKQLVVYCRSGRRAGIFIKSLEPEGFKLMHLTGDMNAWMEAELPVIKDE